VLKCLHVTAETLLYYPVGATSPEAAGKSRVTPNTGYRAESTVPLHFPEAFGSQETSRWQMRKKMSS